MANDIFNKAREISDKILPISFKNTREAISLNLRTRKNALSHLSHGGAIGIFPGGTVSTSSKLFSQPADPAWRSFTAKMIFKSNALVVPIFFDGNTSRIFQLASHLHPNIRAGLVHNAEIAKLVRQHNDANVLVLPGRFIDVQEAIKCVENFLNTEFESGRHKKRIDKI